MHSSLNEEVFDVLVIGAGIAGTTAALSAAEAGARVALASSGPIFSGSSFFEGTWGLGLISPENAADAQDLAETIQRVGRGVSIPKLVKVLVNGIGPAIERLEARGCTLKRAENAEQLDFIPCFDYKHRSWHGLGRATYREVISAELERAGVALLPYHDLLDVEDDDLHICGAMLFDQKKEQIVTQRTRSVVLATGGFGGLFSRTLTTADVSATAQAVALNHGASLINCEFIQIMPGLVSPISNVVFNERTFRYALLEGFASPDAAELLAARAGHGPFSASLPDREVDFAIARAGATGDPVVYTLPAELPEFMQTYFDWFSSAYGKSPTERIRIAPYAHASNGGILIDTHASTGVSGLYACGECAGGMHGADRIGGLSSANALVFGEIAGREAAAYAAHHQKHAALNLHGFSVNTLCWASPEAESILAKARELMSQNCLIERSEAGLAYTLQELEHLEGTLTKSAMQAAGFPDNPTFADYRAPHKKSDPAELAKTIQTQHALLSTKALVSAMLARTESRGAHYRSDFPGEDPAQATPLAVKLTSGTNIAANPLT